MEFFNGVHITASCIGSGPLILDQIRETGAFWSLSKFLKISHCQIKYFCSLVMKSTLMVLGCFISKVRYSMACIAIAFQSFTSYSILTSINIKAILFWSLTVIIFSNLKKHLHLTEASYYYITPCEACQQDLKAYCFCKWYYTVYNWVK